MSGQTCSVGDMATARTSLRQTRHLQGKRFKLQGSSLNIYVPSWCIGEIKSSQLLPGTHTTRNIQHHLQAIDGFLAFHATSTIPVEEIADNMGIAAEQASDDTLSKIIRALQLATPRPDATLLNPKDHRTGLYNKHMHQFYLETWYICIDDQGYYKHTKTGSTLQAPDKISPPSP